MDRRRNSAAAVTVNLLRCPRRYWAPPSQQIGRSQNFVVAQLSALAADPIPLLWHQEGPQCSHHLNQPTECQAISTRSRFDSSRRLPLSWLRPYPSRTRWRRGFWLSTTIWALASADHCRRRLVPVISAIPHALVTAPSCRGLLADECSHRSSFAHHATVRARPNVVWSPAQASPARALSCAQPRVEGDGCSALGCSPRAVTVGVAGMRATARKRRRATGISRLAYARGMLATAPLATHSMRQGLALASRGGRHVPPTTIECRALLSLASADDLCTLGVCIGDAAKATVKHNFGRGDVATAPVLAWPTLQPE
jgi:hypothetical protein